MRFQRLLVKGLEREVELKAWLVIYARRTSKMMNDYST